MAFNDGNTRSHDRSCDRFLGGGVFERSLFIPDLQMDLISFSKVTRVNFVLFVLGVSESKSK